MPPDAQPSAPLRDRAERHVFAVLPDLPAIERRALALLELTDVERPEAARELGLEDVPFRFAAKRARKALRRTRAPLAAGARCEKAELLLSDRLDAPLARPDRRWLEIHLARCPRCTEHVALLADARTWLRDGFEAEPPKALEPAPEPAALPPAPETRRLRAVPESPPLPPAAPESARETEADAPPAPEVSAPAEPVGGLAYPTGTKDGPTLAVEEVEETPAVEEDETAAPAPPTPSPIIEPEATPVHAPPPPPSGGLSHPTGTEDRPRSRRARSATAKRALKILAILLVLAGLVAAAIAGLSGVTDHTPQHAPWDSPDAPEVHPAPLVDQ